MLISDYIQPISKINRLNGLKTHNTLLIGKDSESTRKYRVLSIRDVTLIFFDKWYIFRFTLLFFCDYPTNELMDLVDICVLYNFFSREVVEILLRKKFLLYKMF